MLTAFAEKRAGSGVPVSSGFNVETDDYIDKTVSPEELLAKIGQYAK
jgi:DNA-binding response OmpR family regulator